MERKGAWVSKNSMVEQCFDRCAAASLCTIQLREKVEWFGGRYHEPPWKQEGKSGQRDQQFLGRYTFRRP